MALIRCLVWKQFAPEALAAAAVYARRGGGALLADAQGHAEAVLFRPSATTGEASTNVTWAMMDLHTRDPIAIARGRAAGFSKGEIPASRRWVARSWVERDRDYRGPTRAVELDCMTCAACCHESRVLLDADDLLRWKRAGRDDLAGVEYVVKKGSRRTLRMTEAGPCTHLHEKLCGIYPLRPDNCRAFPAGTEPCLFARSDLFGEVDVGLATLFAFAPGVNRAARRPSGVRARLDLRHVERDDDCGFRPNVAPRRAVRLE